MSQSAHWGKPLILAVILTVLSMGTWWFEFKHKPEVEDKEAEAKKVLSLKDLVIREIVIQGSKNKFQIQCAGDATVLCKPGNAAPWNLLAPIKVKADESNVNSMVSALLNLAPSDTISLKDETPEKRESLLKQYGLDAGATSRPGSRRLEIIPAQGATQTLFLGEVHPMGDTIFARTAQDTERVLLLPNYFTSHFDREITHWRNKKLLTLAPHEIDAFSFKGTKGNSYTAERKEGQWIVQSVPGDLETIDGVLNSIAYLQAKGFVGESKNSAESRAVLASAKFAGEFELKRTAGDKTVLTLYEKSMGPKTAQMHLFATVSTQDPLFELDPSARERIEKTAKELRLSKLITSMDRFLTKKIILEGKAFGDKPWVIDHDGARWIDSDTKKELQASLVQDLLDRLSSGKIQDFLEAGKVPAAAEPNDTLTLKLSDDKGEVKHQFQIWKIKKDLYGKNLLSKRAEVLKMDPYLLDKLPWNREFFMTKSEPKK